MHTVVNIDCTVVSLVNFSLRLYKIILLTSNVISVYSVLCRAQCVLGATLLLCYVVIYRRRRSSFFEIAVSPDSYIILSSKKDLCLDIYCYNIYM